MKYTRSFPYAFLVLLYAWHIHTHSSGAHSRFFQPSHVLQFAFTPCSSFSLTLSLSRALLHGEILRQGVISPCANISRACFDQDWLGSAKLTRSHTSFFLSHCLSLQLSLSLHSLPLFSRATLFYTQPLSVCLSVSLSTLLLRSL